MVVNALQVAGISLLKFQTLETGLRSSLVPGLNKVPGNVDSNNVSSQTGQGNCRSTISTAEVQNTQRRRYPERLNERLSRLTH